jgi:hypothetical protein
LFFPLTLIAELDNGNPLVDQEQFGPALPIIRSRKLDDAIGRANDNPNGLGGSIWSKYIHKARDLALQLECGTVWINKHGAIQPNAPFGGLEGSGFGVEFGEEGLFESTNVQTRLFVAYRPVLISLVTAGLTPSYQLTLGGVAAEPVTLVCGIRCSTGGTPPSARITRYFAPFFRCCRSSR